MILRYAPQGVPLQEEFERLEQAIREFDEVITDKSRIFAQWLLDTCDMWGYNLDLTTCSRCGRTLEKPAADFFPETGGFVCQACLGVEHPRARLETLNGLWALQTGDKIEHPEFTENALLTYLRHHIGFLKEIHSIKFLNETRKLFDYH
jgi:DNA repair protein RecO (recombination protein O)